MPGDNALIAVKKLCDLVKTQPNRILKPCETSPIRLCKKTYPHQLSSKETTIMKNLLLEERFRIIALKDIPYSNSLIEAQNKLFKYRYLFRQEYDVINGLRKVFGEDVKDYNYIRPHISLGAYTPFEKYSGVNGLKDTWKEQIREARRERLRVNSVEICRIYK